MSKIVFLPGWLVSTLTPVELVEFIKSDKPEKFIATKGDLVNYYAATFEFLKYEFLGLYNTIDVEFLNTVLQHPIKKLPELYIYYGSERDTPVNLRRLFQEPNCSNQSAISELGFIVRSSPCKTVTYVMGTNASCHQSNDSFINVEERVLLSREIMRSCFNSLQIQDGRYDMGKPFRNHHIHTQLYLNNLMHGT